MSLLDWVVAFSGAVTVAAGVTVVLVALVCALLDGWKRGGGGRADG